MDKKQTFTLTQNTIDRLTSAAQGNCMAHAYACLEGYAAGVKVTALRNAIRATGAMTMGNEPISAGMQAAAVTAVNGVPFADDAEKAMFVANAIVKAKADHAARVANDRKEKAAEKAEKEKAEKAAAEKAKTPVSVQLKTKRDELLKWIADAEQKAAALLGEIAAAEKAETEAAAAAAEKAETEKAENIAKARLVLLQNGFSVEKTALALSLNAAETEMAWRAQKAAKKAAKEQKAAEKAEKALKAS